MKRLLFTLTLAVLIIVAFAFAAEKPSLQDTKTEGVKAAKAKAASSKEIKLNATGKVMEVSETNIKIERNVKGKDGAPEIMEFVLEKPKKVEIGDKVNVTYIKKEGQKVALHVAKVTAIKKSTTKAEKSTDVKQAPVGPASR
ncbi:MAG: hypothetical protein ABSC57_06505 [Syntrophales bacterium]